MWAINNTHLEPFYEISLWRSMGSNTTLEIAPVTNMFEKLLTVTLSWASLPLACAVSSIVTSATLFDGPSLVELVV